MNHGITLVYNKKPYKRRNKKRKFEDLFKKFGEKLDHSEESENDSDEENDYLDEDVTYKDNRIYFKTNITGDSIDKLIKIIESRNRKFKKYLTNNKMIKTAEPNPLYLHITSYGGDLLATFRAIDAIKRSEIPIYTIVDGYAASGATLMSVVGKKRYMTPSSYMLIHQLSSGAIGKYWEIKDDFENCDTWMNDIYNIYLEHSNMTLKDLKEYLSHDIWWKVDISIDNGLVDEIYDVNF